VSSKDGIGSEAARKAELTFDASVWFLLLPFVFSFAGPELSSLHDPTAWRFGMSVQ